MVEPKYIQDFENWCLREHIRLIPNTDVFFITERKTLMPMYKLGNNHFVHLVDEDVPEEDYDMYRSFAQSFYTIIVIPKQVVGELIKYFTKKDVNKYFKLSI